MAIIIILVVVTIVASFFWGRSSKIYKVTSDCLELVEIYKDCLGKYELANAKSREVIEMQKKQSRHINRY